ncbi:SRPBCC domain-containing protein [Lysobacter sp. LF1]|uniref:SRPBCC domain-containing protein n=1 Tax=Lysobacter stagni TaxID=3045172 RepID=A0ABT6XDZ2_9GAMM|nr:SRPBCC domain-containing protein [Lysobacter sp. LF1]MDI9238276.1 SRPBCC domain-containing protein [Lysobacter sp. LF1]
MNDQRREPDTQSIVLDEVFPHASETIWKALTTGDLIARWMMAPRGFEPVVGNRFTFQTTPAGEWDGLIHCQVLDVVPCERLSYRWRGGHSDNLGYGAPLDTVVTWTLVKADHGTRVRLVHSGFVLPKNDTAFRNMSEGWKKVVRNLDAVAGDADALPASHDHATRH